MFSSYNLEQLLYIVLKITCFSFCRTRSGKIRVLSFKVGVILMCNGHIDEKYKCKYPLCKLLHPLFAHFSLPLIQEEQVISYWLKNGR